MSSPTNPEGTARRRRRERPRGDVGMTLVEMVLGVTIAAFVMASISMSLIVVLRSDRPTSERITESKDVAFLQTYLPVDYSSATSRNVEPGHQPVGGQTLPGTNVLSLVRTQPSGGGTVNIVISYRYVQNGADWQLVRYEFGNPINGGSLTSTVVAHQLAAPPDTWNASMAPAHAVVVNARNGSGQLVGDDMQVTFKSGNAFTTGGASLAANTELPTDYSGGTSDPAVVRSRCGGRVTLVLDTSGSIAWYSDGPSGVRSAATGFIDAFTGTPSELSITAFEAYGYPVYPYSHGQYFSVLNPGTDEITQAKADVAALVYSGGTNWEDGLYLATRDDWGTKHAALPELIVFVSDGDPTWARTYPDWFWYADTDEQNQYLTDQAVAAANYARERDVRVIGVLVGDAATRPASVDRLEQVVGDTAWNGTSATDIGNAATADYFIAPGGDFGLLGGILKAVVAGECGGTVTVQKKIEVGGVLTDPTQPWSYTTDTGVRELDPADEAWITMDYTFPAGSSTRTVQLIEQPASGFSLNRVECTSAGVALGSGRVRNISGVPGVEVDIRPNEAVSCTFISRPV